MPQKLILYLTAAFAVVSFPVHAQQYVPKSIQFKGDPDHSSDELLAVSGLKKGDVLTNAQMNDASKRLMDTGMFAGLNFKFDGQDLVFSLTPATDLCQIRLENLPLASGKELDARLHELLPLYHGKVPAEGGLTESVRTALEKLLADQGIQATVSAIANAGASTGGGGVIHFSIATPPVVVGPIRVKDASAPLDSGALEILTKLTGSPYDAVGSSGQISTYLDNYYHDKGYLEAAVEAMAQNASVSDGAVRIPFEVSVQPGIQYRLSAVRLAPEMVVKQADFDRQASLHPGDIADGQHLIENWQFLNRQFHNHGYMKASIHPAPVFDRANRTVSFDVTADPGPVYTMGALSLENVSDDLRAMMTAAWKMPEGATFNEGAIMSFYGIDETVNPALRRVFTSASCKFTLRVNDDKRTVDVVLRLERKR